MANRSAAQVGAQQTINAAHVIESLAIRTAEQSDTTTSANASLTLSSSAATADYNYISLAATGLATAAKTYADHLADLTQTKADARAQAQRDLTVNQDMPAYQNALDEADQDYGDNLSGYEQTYNTTAGNAIST
ncbi:MAG: hypothetical protein QG550_1914, partial [Pseudomonadota bacterium]|nr:hypothetical protein [Pseudomonadota bacterium]